jgi:HEAT repeat protein
LGLVSAQQPDNRTTTTVIADILAQVPANNREQYTRQQKELIATGENGIIQLVKMMETPGEGKVKTEYALNGLSAFVSAQGEERARLTLANAYLKALDVLSDRESKAFIIRQLGVAGKEEAVDKLSSYLTNEALSEPAIASLVSIRNPASDKALLDALETAGDHSLKRNCVLAIAQLEIPGSENALKALINSTDADLQSAALLALGNNGSKASLPDLALAAEKVNYAPGKNTAVDAYLRLIDRLLTQGETKEAVKAATALLKKAEKAGQIHTQEAALQLLMKANPDKVPQLLKNALNNRSRDYRNAALNYALDNADAVLCKNLAGRLKNADSELKLDLLNWFTTVCENPRTARLIDASYTETVAGLLTDSHLEVKTAAAAFLAKSGESAAIAALAHLLNSPDEQTVALAKNTLIFTKGNIAPAIVPFLPTATDKGKAAILDLLAIRKSDEQATVVFEQLDADSPEVRRSAYAALKDLAGEKDLALLYQRIEKSNSENRIAIQQAIIAALKKLPAEKQFETIIRQINQTEQGKQLLYYSVLAASGNAKALEWIISRFETGNTGDKEAAFQALLDWQGFESAYQLLAICKDATAPAYFDRALERYITLASGDGLTGENRRIFLTNALNLAKTDAVRNEILKHIGQTDSFLGLMLAGEYLNRPDVRQAAANAVMNIALNNKNHTGKNVRKLLEKAAEILNNPDADYQREAIRKHLSEMPEENGFAPIFNGTDLTGWKGLVENPITRAQMKPAELAKKQAVADATAKEHWIPVDNMLVFDGMGGDNLCTNKPYGDFEMYVDWKLEPAPEADAGIYLRGAPQVQIWNIARVKDGAQVGSGGLYNNRNNRSTPLKVADNQLGEWNNFYIKMIGDRVTVLLNGEPVVDNIILENYWDRSQPIFPVESIELQAHGSKVYYRNLYVKEWERPQPFELTAEEKKEGFKLLFDGTNMHEWTGNTADYILEDGCISLHPSQSHGGNLYTKKEFGNFLFRFEFLLTPDANNGLGIRTPMEGDAAYVGMELQILDNEAPVYKDLAPYQYHGSVYGVIPAKRGFLKPTGEWNYQEVLADGDHIQITLNGTVILDGNIREAVKDGIPDKQDHPGLFNKTGHIGFLGHGSHVKFKNIRIKDIKKIAF